MKKPILFVVTAILALTNITSAQVVFDGGPDGMGTDFFDEANWLDTATGLDPGADTINPNAQVIDFNLTIGGDFAVDGTGIGNGIRFADGGTLTLEDNATFSCEALVPELGQRNNIVLTDTSEIMIAVDIVRTDFDVSGEANVVFTGNRPEFGNDTINFSSDWTGSVSTQLPNGNRSNLVGANGAALFNLATIEGEVASSDDIDTIIFGALVIHTLAVPPLLGDINRDEVIDFSDIAPFIELLLNPFVFRDEADINQDGEINFSDIAPFIMLLSGGGQ